MRATTIVVSIEVSGEKDFYLDLDDRAWHVMLGFSKKNHPAILLETFGSLLQARAFAAQVRLSKHVVLRRNR